MLSTARSPRCDPRPSAVASFMSLNGWPSGSLTELRMSEIEDPHWLPSAAYDRVAVTCTARHHGGEPRRLPDRNDVHGVIAAILVDEPGYVEEVFRRLDRPGRTIYVDVERKQMVDLFAVAMEVVAEATLAHIKPNDVTIRSLDVFVSRALGPDLRAARCGVYGTGNLGFKSALLLAERNAHVFVAGRSDEAVRRTVTAINAILPHHHEWPVGPWTPSDRVHLMVTAVTARGVVGRTWCDRLERGAQVVDVGIDNLHGEFIAEALAAGATVTRLDTRAAESQVLVPAPGFFDEVYGSARVGDVPIVSGGVIGERGVVVVDNLVRPTMVVGVANGMGGLVPPAELTTAERERMANVQGSIPRR